jgi:amidohydrolase
MRTRPRLSLVAATLLTATVAVTAAATRADAQSVNLQSAGSPELIKLIEAKLPAVMPKVVAWRRDLHQHPELSFEEVRTSAIVAKHLQSLGIEVQTGIGKTGVVGILRGGKPGPVIALRADMDGLPVTELVDLPFKSTVKTQWQGQEVGVMHACGHDNHVAILMGAAEVLAGMKASVPGTVKFIFQPAEEGLGGAKAMLADNAFANPAPSAVFGLHVWPNRVGQIAIRQGPMMAAAGNFKIIVKGRQTHGSQPWSGVDPIVVSAQVILGLQTIVSRQVNVAYLPSVLTVGQITGGNRSNIIPDSVVLVGTLRTFDDNMRADIATRIKRTAEDIAHSAGASAIVTVDQGGLVTSNDTTLTERMLPTLRRAAGANGVQFINPVMGSEDFPEFTRNIPGVFFFLGVTPKDRDLNTVAVNHSPLFFADEGALEVGVRAMAGMAMDYLSMNAGKKAGNN